MDREEAARLVDRALNLRDRSYEDGRCGSCEAVVQERKVPVEEVPDAARAAYPDHPSDTWIDSKIEHGPECPVTAFQAAVPEIERQHGFKFALTPRSKVLPNGSTRTWTRMVRVPEPGDPPVPE